MFTEILLNESEAWLDQSKNSNNLRLKKSLQNVLQFCQMSLRKPNEISITIRSWNQRIKL
jgi:hypothetical protein